MSSKRRNCYQNVRGEVINMCKQIYKRQISGNDGFS